MEHLFLFRKQAHELKLHQMVEEINLGRHTIESAVCVTRRTVTGWLGMKREPSRVPVPR